MAINEPEAPLVGDKGLQAGAIGLVGNVVIGLAAVVPAYSLESASGATPNLPGLHGGSYSGGYRCAGGRGAARRRLTINA